LQEIMVSMGGRIAEEIVFDDVTTGASQDIRQATETARNMVMKYGMSDKIGFINYEQSQDEVFMGRDLGHMKTYGTDTVNEIESEVRRIISECYEKAKAIISSRKEILEAGVALLLEQEKIGQEEFEALYARVEGD
ncbi:MAG: cell division protein FtsH, partial [Lachnospiraceae bacterium]|nr:cell division protein FtsH [Lachnospiraceae bacterium]